MVPIKSCNILLKFCSSEKRVLDRSWNNKDFILTFQYYWNWTKYIRNYERNQKHYEAIQKKNSWVALMYHSTLIFRHFQRCQHFGNFSYCLISTIVKLLKLLFTRQAYDILLRPRTKTRIANNWVYVLIFCIAKWKVCSNFNNRSGVFVFEL